MNEEQKQRATELVSKGIHTTQSTQVIAWPPSSMRNYPRAGPEPVAWMVKNSLKGHEHEQEIRIRQGDK